MRGRRFASPIRGQGRNVRGDLPAHERPHRFRTGHEPGPRQPVDALKHRLRDAQNNDRSLTLAGHSLLLGIRFANLTILIRFCKIITTACRLAGACLGMQEDAGAI
jgi:hypothetical protein